MNKRRVIQVPGLKHKNPIPLASRIGSLLVTGSIPGKDPETGQTGTDLESQCRLMFGNVRRIMEAAGGTTDDIIKLSVWLKDIHNKKPLNEEWIAMFPDLESQPARHTFGDKEMLEPYLAQCEVMAILDES